MIIYTDTKERAEEIAEMMKKEEPELAEDVQICETRKDSIGIFSREDLGKFVVFNETE